MVPGRACQRPPQAEAAALSQGLRLCAFSSRVPQLLHASKHVQPLGGQSLPRARLCTGENRTQSYPAAHLSFGCRCTERSASSHPPAPPRCQDPCRLCSVGPPLQDALCTDRSTRVFV